MAWKKLGTCFFFYYLMLISCPTYKVCHLVGKKSAVCLMSSPPQRKFYHLAKLQKKDREISHLHHLPMSPIYWTWYGTSVALNYVCIENVSNNWSLQEKYWKCQGNWKMPSSATLPFHLHYFLPSLRPWNFLYQFFIFSEFLNLC